MKIKFTKMQGLGNDFVVIDACSQNIQLLPEQIRRIADRHFGIGCDQLLLVEPSPIADFRYRIFNADGVEVAQCGNGARCFAKFVYEKDLTDKTRISVETASGLIDTELLSSNNVRVNMGVPKFKAHEIPFVSPDTQGYEYIFNYPLPINNTPYVISLVSMGNPHAVCFLFNQDLAYFPVNELGSSIETHPYFPQRVNVNFVQIISPNEIGLRVFERGVGETLACGSGACASSVIGISQNLLFSPVSVNMPGGQLRIDWAGKGYPVYMTGPAETVFEGVVDMI